MVDTGADIHSSVLSGGRAAPALESKQPPTQSCSLPMTRVPPEGMAAPLPRTTFHTSRPLSYSSVCPSLERQVTCTAGSLYTSSDALMRKHLTCTCSGVRAVDHQEAQGLTAMWCQVPAAQHITAFRLLVAAHYYRCSSFGYSRQSNSLSVSRTYATLRDAHAVERTICRGESGLMICKRAFILHHRDAKVPVVQDKKGVVRLQWRQRQRLGQ